MFSLLLLVVKNIYRFVFNDEIHTLNTRQCINLHLPSVNLTKYNKGVYYMGIVIFNHLPRDIRELSYDVIKFKSVIKNFFLKESFYSINDYLEWSAKQN
jgi:hypothetical protein